MYGKLYLVPTPIGNLQDITLRALDTLRNVDIIAAEDTRQTLKLLNHFDIKKSLISYHKYNEYEKGDYIIEKLKQGLNIAIVSDAGTPGISDPGSVIVSKCISQGMEFEVLTGATAITTALVYSGMDTTKFIFRGFLPRDNKERSAVIDSLKNRMETLIFYEAPHRIKNTLKFLRENLGNRNIAVCRELTKLHEEVLRMSLDDALDYFADRDIKGEFVLVVKGKSEEEINKDEEALWDKITIDEHIKMYIKKGLSKKEAVKKVAKDRNLPKSEIYKYSIGM
ncbi:16S rRNA (cytidine(1402)-2'-O)-methyltransferase [Clostridium fermenticellae]|uniref:Ribosomal RNA small subunit methyltransferase I n=1 Tax=Clostridium fermenticellae TaxID=2068654 RepID=A0A386H0L2_9CLOT|nr:16S rRNA (cytidine(1402)-2'-O)-methyltransferase [Clostridium fermenticellae]AYD39113.1 16S rRNA (cytidine(1402)-2'-O)-methyltransferase [Clostridium fermenticellae]